VGIGAGGLTTGTLPQAYRLRFGCVALCNSLACIEQSGEVEMEIIDNIYENPEFPIPSLA
jgi:hypothetical protein